MISSRIALIALGLALSACKPQSDATNLTPNADARTATAQAAALATPTAAPVIADSCPDADFEAFVEKFSADIAVQEKATADPLSMTRIDAAAQPEPAQVTREVPLTEVEWPVIPNLEAVRKGGREVLISQDASSRTVLVRTSGTDDQQRYHFKQLPCWTLVEVDDQSL